MRFIKGKSKERNANAMQMNNEIQTAYKEALELNSKLKFSVRNMKFRNTLSTIR